MNLRRATFAVLVLLSTLALVVTILGKRTSPPRSTQARTPNPALANKPGDLSPAAGEGDAKSRTAVAGKPSDSLRAELQRLLVRRNVRPSEAVLTFATREAFQAFLDRAQHHGLTVLGQLDALLTVRVRYDSLAPLEADLREHGADYTNIGANSLVSVPQKPAKENRDASVEVPFRNSALTFLGVPADHAAWGRGVRIAILDSGVALDATFGSSRLQYIDIGLGTLPGVGGEDGHGTSVASLAAGQSVDAPGVAPGSTLLSIRVTDNSGHSDLFTVARAILAATDAGVPIINLSLGGYATGAALTAAIDYATARGTVIVAAAGNDQANQLTWPAADPRVISVGAVDALAQQVAFSNSGPQLQIAAPGYGVQTAWLNGNRVYVDGTSASAPLVAGAIAAVMSQNPAMSAVAAWSILQRTASDAGAPGADPSYGAGVLNLDWAINYNNPRHSDPAVASHYYDAAHDEMDFVIQNRSASAARNLGLDVDLNGTTTSHRLPDIAAGASYVLKLPLAGSRASTNQTLTFTTQLVTPFGLEDANTRNNRLTTRLVGTARQ